MMPETLHCDRCRAPLENEDFTRNRAFMAGGLPYCSACVGNAPVAPAAQTAVDRSAAAIRLIWTGAALASAGLLIALFVILKTPSRPPQRLPDVRAELQALEARLEGPLKRDQFGAAIDLLKEGRKSIESPEWAGAIDRRIEEIEGHAKRLYSTLREEAVQAKTRGDHEEVTRLTGVVTRWGIPSRTAELERELAATVSAPIPPSGLRFVPEGVQDGRVRRRYGSPKGFSMEAVPEFSYRAVGFEGDLFAVPSDGEVEVNYVSDAKQTMMLRLWLTNEHKQLVPFERILPDPAPGQETRARIRIQEIRALGGRPLVPGTVIQRIFVTGQDSKIAFRVTRLVVTKRQD